MNMREGIGETKGNVMRRCIVFFTLCAFFVSVGAIFTGTAVASDVQYLKLKRYAEPVKLEVPVFFQSLARTGEGPNLGERIPQEKAEVMPHWQLIREGMRIFTTPFNALDGYGDGPEELSELDPLEDGARPTLQGNGLALRVNGLDAQSCFACHFIADSGAIPPKLAVGGAAGVAANVTLRPIRMDTQAHEENFDGRFINPPFLFGAGGVELLGKEMTADLQEQKAAAMARPGTFIALSSKGVSFGSIVYKDGAFDTSRVHGVGTDLVVKPFGRKFEFISVRAFDVGALSFHFGMQAVEKEGVGHGNDADKDGIVDEVLVGDVSCMHAFGTSLARPYYKAEMDGNGAKGFDVFNAAGCSSCHVPFLRTEGRYLPQEFPEVPEAPFTNVFSHFDLKKAGFKVQGSGVVVPLFSDLRTHNMGPALAESAHFLTDEENASFGTARLWGLAGTAPYLHDGRASTVNEAILYHGGEAEFARENYEALSSRKKQYLMDFLYGLKTPQVQ